MIKKTVIIFYKIKNRECGMGGEERMETAAADTRNGRARRKFTRVNF